MDVVQITFKKSLVEHFQIDVSNQDAFRCVRLCKPSEVDHEPSEPVVLYIRRNLKT